MDAQGSAIVEEGSEGEGYSAHGGVEKLKLWWRGREWSQEGVRGGTFWMRIRREI